MTGILAIFLLICYSILYFSFYDASDADDDTLSFSTFFYDTSHEYQLDQLYDLVITRSCELSVSFIALDFYYCLFLASCHSFFLVKVIRRKVSFYFFRKSKKLIE